MKKQILLAENAAAIALLMGAPVYAAVVQGDQPIFGSASATQVKAMAGVNVLADKREHPRPPGSVTKDSVLTPPTDVLDRLQTAVSSKNYQDAKEPFVTLTRWFQRVSGDLEKADPHLNKELREDIDDIGQELMKRNPDQQELLDDIRDIRTYFPIVHEKLRIGR